MNMKSGVYQIINIINGKRYIGSSIDVERRFKEHRRHLCGNYHHNEHLQNAWNKYGEESFMFELIERCEPEDCAKIEQQFIDYYKSANRKFGYNIDEQIEHAGYHLSAETKEKIRKKAIGRKQSAESIEKTRLANTGKKRPKQSQKMKDRWEISKQYFGWNNLSPEKQEEIRRKASIKSKERHANDEYVINNMQCKPLRVIDNNVVLYFRSLHEAAKYYGVNKGTFAYAAKTQSYKIHKLGIVFEYITSDEYLKNKTSGEK